MNTAAQYPLTNIINPQYRLETHYFYAEDEAEDVLEFTLSNLGTAALENFTLTLSCIIRLKLGAEVNNASLIDRLANLHTFSPPASTKLEAGEQWRFRAKGLRPCRPNHRVDGPSSGYITDSAGNTHPISVGDLHRTGFDDTKQRRAIPAGKTEIPLAIQPWPNNVAITSYFTDSLAYSASKATTNELQAVATISALANRLHPASQQPFIINPTDAAKTICIGFHQQTDLPTDGYELRFSKGQVDLRYNDASGLSYGLTVLAQIHHAAVDQPELFHMPSEGIITDSPRHSWRGSHLDVSRHFWPKADILRFLDILAWSRMNLFQWHLTDDEGWRLEIKSLPELTEQGAIRGPKHQMKGQHDYSHQTYHGYYTQADAKEIIDHAASLHIDVLPEIDIPGHCHTVLTVLPHLRDPDEPANSYHSIQYYANNALNPGMQETYEFLEVVLQEVAKLFPYTHIHVGADEVDGNAWKESPKAQQLAAEKGLTDTIELQAYLLSKVQTILRKFGKELAGWDEVSHGGGVDKQNTLLIAWQTPDIIQQLCQQGYEVIASPGQAYYMDQAQATGWMEPGASWAGTCTPEHCYRYEAIEGLSEAETQLVKGVQACIWCEHISTKQHFNYMVFPRLYAVGEAGWTESQHKDWLRHCAIVKTMPTL
jgi:hexosaminidase